MLTNVPLIGILQICVNAKKKKITQSVQLVVNPNNVSLTDSQLIFHHQCAGNGICVVFMHLAVGVNTF